MITILIIIGISGFVYCLFNELEDESIKSNWKYYRQYFNTNLSWKNKWKLNSNGNQILYKSNDWYYFTVYPKYKERFVYSSTILVFLTDGEHVFQFMKNRAIEIGFLIVGWQFVVAWIIGKSLMSFIKEKFLDWLN